MACPSIITGDQFLTRVLGHIDCQAQTIGTFGFQALGQPGSLATTFIAGLLTLFVALIGVRLLFGPPPGARDLVYDTLKVGIVLTLAFSWPAFRTLVLDVVMDGPASIVAHMGAREDTGGGLVSRMQAADDAMLDLTRAGTGRNTGAFVDARAPGGTFQSTALNDESGYAWSRLFWLAGIIGSFGLLRLVAGILLALAPLAAGLLLFDATRGLFTGWLRGLVLALIGTVGATVVVGVELTAIGPWLADALRVRALGYATPAAPTELLALTLGFALIQVGMLFVLARVAFTRGWTSPVRVAQQEVAIADTAAWAAPSASSMPHIISRADRIADSVEIQLRRENGGDVQRTSYRLDGRSSVGGGSATGTRQASAPYHTPLGASYRRTHSRASGAARSRDLR